MTSQPVLCSVLSRCVLVCVVVLVVGCGWDPQQPTHFPVGGRVTFDGEPVSGGTVMFYNNDTTGGGPIDTQGNFRVVGDGLKPGLYFVAVTPPVPFDTPPSPNRNAVRRKIPEFPEIPMKYRLPTQSGFQRRVEQTENVFEFAMVSQPDEAQSPVLPEEARSPSGKTGESDSKQPVDNSRDDSSSVNTGGTKQPENDTIPKR